MAKFVVVPRLGDILVGAYDAGSSMEEANAAALHLLRRNRGTIYDVHTNENRPIDSIMICEVVHEGVPVFSLEPKQAEQPESQPVAQ